MVAYLERQIRAPHAVFPNQTAAGTSERCQNYARARTASIKSREGSEAHEKRYARFSAG